MTATMADSIEHEKRIDAIQQALRAQGLEGWLFYDFRGSDPLAYRILQIDPARHVTRRWYYLIPARGRPAKLLHRIEPHTLEELPGETHLYVSWKEQQERLGAILTGLNQIAMQYSPMNAIPYISRVDAGTIELVQSFGLKVVTSADLIQRFEAVLNDWQVETHREAADILRRIVDETFDHIAEQISVKRRLTEYDVQQFMLRQIAEHGFITGSPPIAAVNANSADPHYTPSSDGSVTIGRGDLILIDLWAKRPAAGSVYGDITWTGFAGSTVPSRHAEIFSIVRSARDVALQFVGERAASGSLPYGWEVDDACRQVIREAGYSDQFVHRTGHSIGEEVHGNGTNMDNLETRDGRRLLPRTCFSIEPGIYLAGEFGIRSELDVFLSDREALVFGQPLQNEIIPLLR